MTDEEWNEALSKWNNILCLAIMETEDPELRSFYMRQLV